MSSAAGDREQKMLDSTTQNLSERLTEVRKTLGTLITKVSRSLRPFFCVRSNGHFAQIILRSLSTYNEL